MKKILSIFCATIFLSTQAQASTGLFIGVDALQSHAKHEASNSSVISGPSNGDKMKADNTGYGANLGFRFDPLMLYASAEVFYERLNSSSRGFNQNISGIGPNFQMDDRYGAKANLGITILPWLTPFITYGVARVNYNTDSSGNKTAPLYGVGILFDIPLTNFSVKAAYDMQKLNNISYQNGRSDTNLGVAHIGLTYTFASI